MLYCCVVLRDLDDHICHDNERRNAKLRLRAIQEICFSETNYIHQLDKLITVSTVQCSKVNAYLSTTLTILSGFNPLFNP